MGGRAGGGANGGMGSASRSRFASIPGIKAIRDPQVRNELIQTLEDYDKEFGVRQTNIILESLGDYKGQLVGGEARVTAGKTSEIALNSKLFDKSSKDVTKIISDAQKGGFMAQTKNPIRHILAHELAHATWQPGHFTKGEGYKTKQLKNQVVGAYRKFLNDKSAKGWGAYAKSSYGEFFAEGVAKHMYGAKDKHTQAIVKIINDWKL